MLLYIFGEVNLKLKKAFLFQLFVILFISIFCALGTWQLYRLQWKLEIINQITVGLNSNPVEYSNLMKKNYQRVNTKGKYIFDEQIYLYSLNDSGKPGYDVITPFRTHKNENLLVNRGWISKEFKGNPGINSKKNEEQKIVGLLRKVYKPNMFKPANDIENNVWFSINLKDLNNFTGKKFNEFIIFLEDSETKVPLPKKISIDVPNNHLKYAITWYAISISIIFYYLYFRRKK
ncbi:MAG: surfeit locus protein 1 [Pelagibacteraceae bacterium]|nr:surfeit locus protein 1 [Pelagibacteraceae bacterium]